MASLERGESLEARGAHARLVQAVAVGRLLLHLPAVEVALGLLRRAEHLGVLAVVAQLAAELPEQGLERHAKLLVRLVMEQGGHAGGVVGRVPAADTVGGGGVGGAAVGAERAKHLRARRELRVVEASTRAQRLGDSSSAMVTAGAREGARGGAVRARKSRDENGRGVGVKEVASRPGEMHFR